MPRLPFLRLMNELELAQLVLAAERKECPEGGIYYDHGPLRVIRLGEVLAIAGSHNIWDWIQNINWLPSPMTGFGRVHRGWLYAANALKSWGKADGVKIITGHSYGAPVALILGVLMYPTEPDIRVVQFSPPSCGDRQFCKNVKFPVKRIWLSPDLVTWLYPFYGRVGDPTSLKGTFNFYRNHSMANIVSALGIKKRPDLTLLKSDQADMLG